ncbi:hypothetical protein LCGC14_1037700 [marine sediment metagenome]|uniref:DUF4326 domain-containing protein n=1 Tax=marine sediment metagenome TaxID=412755 RepID=A0A0F9NED7_9ZZZZ
MTPKRIQRKRTKGWKMPTNTISVTRPGKWGNPFKVGGTILYDNIIEEINTSQLAVDYFENGIKFYGSPVTKEQIKKELKGKNLACWCKIVDKNDNYMPCHADILLSLANNLTLKQVKNENIRQEKLLQKGGI